MTPRLGLGKTITFIYSVGGTDSDQPENVVLVCAGVHVDGGGGGPAGVQEQHRAHQRPGGRPDICGGVDRLRNRSNAEGCTQQTRLRR